MLKKVLCWLLIFQHINVYVLRAATGDIKILFEEEDVAPSSSTSKFRLKLLQETDEGDFQSKVDTVFETLDSSSRTFKPHFSRDGNDFKVKTDGATISLVSHQRDNSFAIVFNRDGKTDLKNFKTKNFIDIATYGDIFAKTNSRSSALSLSGKNFKNEALFNVDNFNLTLTGTEEKKGSFINGSSAQFIIGKEAHLHQGDLENQGRITGKNKSFLDLNGNDFVNMNVGQKRGMSFRTYLTWEDQFSILNAGIFRNQTDIISSKDNTNCQLTLNARKFINEARGTIFSSKNLNISCLKDFTNRGEIKSEEEVNLYASGNLLNFHKIQSNNSLKLEAGRLKNKGRILGDVTDIKGKILVKNEGTFKARDFSLTTPLMLNTHDIKVTEKGQIRGSLLLNKGSVTSKGSLDIKKVS